MMSLRSIVPACALAALFALAIAVTAQPVPTQYPTLFPTLYVTPFQTSAPATPTALLVAGTPPPAASASVQAATPDPAAVEATVDPLVSEAALAPPGVTVRLSGEYIAQVAVETLNARELPAREAEAIGSLFEDEWLEIVGRNLDGTWFEVRRPARMTSVGWVLAEYLDYDFRPEGLPLTDFTTGVTGPMPLTRAEPFAAYLIERPVLRAQPLRTSQSIGVLPSLVVVPVLARNQDGSWLLVNHLGEQGWISAASTRHSIDLSQVFEPSDLPPLETIPRMVIPLEIQQAQIDRLRSFINDRIGLARGLEAFWWQVYRGETMPCSAPAQVAYYPFTEADVRELPELQRYAPQIASAVDYLAIARAPLLQCGVIAPVATVDARNAAINARVQFEATLERLEVLEANVVLQDR